MGAEISRAALPATAVVAGRGQGAPLLLDEPLSFWGGYDSARGSIVEAGHPQCGAGLAGRVLLMERAKGSSSSSSVLAEAIRNGTGPAAIIMRERDLIIGLGCIVASELYGLHVPLAIVDESTWQALASIARSGTGEVRIDAAACGDCLLHIGATPTPGAPVHTPQQRQG